MGRFLFVVPPLAGHINPTLSVGAQLLSCGHEVLWAGHEALLVGGDGPLGDRLPKGGTFMAVEDNMGPEDYRKIVKKSPSVSGLQSLKFLYEDVFIPMARGTMQGVASIVERVKPDVIINDQQAFAGAVVAWQKKIPYATFCTTSAGVQEPLEGFHRVNQWEHDRMIEFQQSVGVACNEKVNTSARLAVIFSSPLFVGEHCRFPDHYRFVGPSITHRIDTTPFPFARLKKTTTPKVLISLGTVNQDHGKAFFSKIVEAFEHRDLTVVAVAPGDFFDRIPDNFIIRKRIPQLDVLPHVDCVVSHAGHNTVCESLMNGLPLVVTPIKDDQSKVASQVVAAGAGLRLKYRRFKPSDMHDAVMTLIHDPSYRENALRIKASFVKAGGAEKAARCLEELKS
ncbi:nucleotide disphospho-sugar-binding domain-containing protein [Desulfoluna sp.]|uniref:glycosyltransferase n=1 Tax=Desulfoluna sp. TaxID=2045199 RepID=UPI002613AA18|nr:nucleotide disphospho-sugar-binding domain-containing protein [Desulfoluna sp.]